MRRYLLVGVLAGMLAGSGSGSLAAQGTATHGSQALGTIRLPQRVMANGQPLAAGLYQVRLTAEEAKPEAKGQTPAYERWVEFVQRGQVKGREVVSIVPDKEIAQVAESRRVARGASRVEMLKGRDYVRVWIHRGDAHYLIHLPPANRS